MEDADRRFLPPPPDRSVDDPPALPVEEGVR